MTFSPSIYFKTLPRLLADLRVGILTLTWVLDKGVME